MTDSGPPLEQPLIIDLTWGIAGGYATKLLTDAGARVLKVEPPGGDPLRNHRSPEPGRPGRLFAYLAAGKRSMVLDLEQPGDRARLLEWYAVADLVIERNEPGTLDASGVGHGALRQVNRHAPMVSISNFGGGGPWSTGRPANEFTLLAQAGSTSTRQIGDRPPVNADGRIGEWMGGVTAAVAALAALRRSRLAGRGEHVDLSLLETVTPTCTNVQTVWGSFAGVYDTTRLVEIPAIEPTADGYVGFCIFTGQQWQDFTVLIGRPELGEDPELATMGGRNTKGDWLVPLIHEWTTAHTTDEIVEMATLLRIPVAPIGNGRLIPGFEQFVARSVFAPHPAGDFLAPRVPYRIEGHPTVAFGEAPDLGEHPPTGATPTAGTGPGTPGDPPATNRTDHRPAEPPLPLAGLRVLDLTAFWAGPYGAFVLSALGADVIHVESVQRPDGMRFGSSRPPGDDQWWEFGPTFHTANAGKRSITLDLTRPAGRDLLLRLVEHADALIENYSPRVLEQFDLVPDVLQRRNPGLVVVRMPAFGLDGPWRDRVGFAQTMEQVSGMAWLCGWPDLPPVNARGPADPLAGLHAAFSCLLAWEARERTGRGAAVESTMVETALTAMAEQVIEFTGGGELLTRSGNRHHHAAPQGTYRSADGQWVAVSVETDDEWRGLVRALPDAGLAALVDGAGPAARRAVAEALDQALDEAIGGLDADLAVDLLLGHGVPAAPVVGSRLGDRNPQHLARGFYEPVDHPVAGLHPLPGLPFRFTGDSRRWLRRPAPCLGEHTREVLGDLLGLSGDELDRLEAERIIGTRPVGA